MRTGADMAVPESSKEVEEQYTWKAISQLLISMAFALRERND